MLRNIFLILILSVSFSYGISDKESLLRVIQGAYRDRIYSIAIQKSLQYLKNSEKNDTYRADVIKVLMYSLYEKKDKKMFFKWIKKLENENIPKEEKIKIYKLGLNLFKDDTDKLGYLYRKTEKYLSKEEKKRVVKFLAVRYMKEKKWNKIISLPEYKEILLYKVIALYKSGKYKDVIKKTEKLGIFPSDVKDTVLYFRGLAFYRLGDEKKAVDTVEAITFKTPEMIKFLTVYYLKKKNYLYAERYLRILALEDEYRDYAYYYLGVIEDISKNYKKALHYYRKASKYRTKYGELARKRISILEKAVPVYSVRLILFSSKDRAYSYLKKHNLNRCFIKEYKHLYGVYCGRFYTLDEAKHFEKSLKEKGFDTYIQKL